MTLILKLWSIGGNAMESVACLGISKRVRNLGDGSVTLTPVDSARNLSVILDSKSDIIWYEYSSRIDYWVGIKLGELAAEYQWREDWDLNNNLCCA